MITSTLFGLLVVLGQTGGPASLAEKRELHATKWFNNPVFRLHDDRTVILFFFETRPRDDAARNTARILERLNGLTKRRDLVVIGLTADSPHQAESFIRKASIRFTVGARSRSARAFGVDELPALRIIKRGDGTPKVEPATVDSLPSDSHPDSNSGRDELPVRELIRYLDDPTPQMDSFDHAAVVRRLYEAMSPEDFLELAAERLPEATNPWVRGFFEYYSDLAAGVPRDDWERSVSATAVLTYRENPVAPEWEPYRRYLADKTARKDAAVLENTYIEHLVDDPVATLIRRTATEDLWKAPDRDTARSALLNVIQIDPDPSIRMIAAMALSEVCPKGDTQAAELLESLAATEPNAVKTRPVMQRAAQIIREGRTDADTKPPQP